MKNLLINIKQALQDLEYIRDGDVFLSPHIDFFSNTVRFPCIGIKDGLIERESGFGYTIRLTLNVQIAIFVNLPKAIETVFTGDSHRKGLFDIEDDIHALLDDNKFDEFESAWCKTSEETNLLPVSDSDIKQQKVLNYQYEKECEPR